MEALLKGFIYRRKNLPNSIKYIQKILIEENIKCSKKMNDGRTNSYIDEDKIIDILKKDILLKNRLFIPPARHWFDIAIKDFIYGWLPINIKSTTTKTPDNTSNLTMCVYSLTKEKIDLKTSYQNGKMSKILIKCFKNNDLNTNYKKDYYFIVINKNIEKDIIINCLKGLSILTPNINNLPFQIKWVDNKNFIYKDINKVKNMLIETIKKPKPSWREEFLNEIRNL